jgi:uncharacterized membrane protein
LSDQEQRDRPLLVRKKFVAAVIVFASLGATLALGVVVKAPCASGDWSDGKQYESLCYSDIVPLYGTEQLTDSRLPYLDPCQGKGTCDEYPLLTMYAMRLSANFAHDNQTFFYANIALLAAAAIAICLLLYTTVGYRALYFALAPTLLIYGFLNWDLLAVAAATGATVFFLSRDELSAGALLGIGTAAKLYPVLLAPAFLLERWREKKRREALVLVISLAATWLLLNLPFILAAPKGWGTFFRFNSARNADFDSLWFLGCQHFVTHQTFCPPSYVTPINLLSLGIFLVCCVVLYVATALRNRGFPRWTFGFPILIFFLLTNKVYSPQYSLWLLPWFALVRVNPVLFVLFEGADVAVFVTRFSWFGTLSGLDGGSLTAFQVALVIRVVILLATAIAYVWVGGQSAPQRAHPAPAADPASAPPPRASEGRTA